MSDEKRLIKMLMDRYEDVGVVGRPVFNASEQISVKYGLALIQILELNSRNQVLTTNCWSRYVSRVNSRLKNALAFFPNGSKEQVWLVPWGRELRNVWIRLNLTSEPLRSSL